MCLEFDLKRWRRVHMDGYKYIVGVKVYDLSLGGGLVTPFKRAPLREVMVPGDTTVGVGCSGIVKRHEPEECYTINGGAIHFYWFGDGVDTWQEVLDYFDREASLNREKTLVHPARVCASLVSDLVGIGREKDAATKRLFVNMPER